MNTNYSFDPVKLAKETEDAYSADSFTSWLNVVRLLAERGYNRFEAEAILRSKITRRCRDAWVGKGRPTAKALADYLDRNQTVPGCTKVNDLVMETFAEEYDLELNDRGQPCRRGTMPGNYHPDRTTLVPLGTPACCNPHTEQYWSQ